MQTAETAMHIIICKWYKYPEQRAFQFTDMHKTFFLPLALKQSAVKKTRCTALELRVCCQSARCYICTYFSDLAYEKSILNRCVFNFWQTHLFLLSFFKIEQNCFVVYVNFFISQLLISKEPVQFVKFFICQRNQETKIMCQGSEGRAREQLFLSICSR